MQKKRKTNSKIAPKKNTARKPAAKKVVTKKPVAKKTPAKKAACKKPVKKVAAKSTTKKAAAKKPSTKKSTDKTTTKKPANKKTQAIKKEPVRAGQIRTINDSIARGHKGAVLRVNQKRGTADTGILTHAPRTRGRDNIKLQQNPDPKDNSTSYVVKNKHTAKMKNVGKNHPNMQIKNSSDKSLMRHMKKQK